MTQEEFKKRMRVLQGKSVAIEQEMKNLQNEYLSSYPVQPNDKCIDSEGKVYWISRLILATPHSINVHCNSIILVKSPKLNKERRIINEQRKNKISY